MNKKCNRIKGRYLCTMKLIKTIYPALLILGLLVGMGIQSGCKHQPFLDMTIIPGDTTQNPVEHPCSPDTVYFQLQILPILVNNCTMPGCHSASNPAEDIDLTSYAKVMQTGDIKPGKLDGDLWEAINETDSDKRMPRPPAAPLTAEQKNLIRVWILQGAQDLTCDGDSGACDTTNMSFSMDIQPIFNTNCTGCHGGSNPQAGINLSNYSGVSNVLSANRLLGAIKHQAGFTAMPPSGNPLSTCKIDQIEAWVNQGAKNN